MAAAREHERELILRVKMPQRVVAGAAHDFTVKGFPLRLRCFFEDGFQWGEARARTKVQQVVTNGGVFTISQCRNGGLSTMESTLKIALVGAGMFGGDVHLRAYADLQRFGIAGQLARVGLDELTRDLAPVKFELVAIGTRSEASARRAQ